MKSELPKLKEALSQRLDTSQKPAAANDVSSKEVSNKKETGLVSRSTRKKIDRSELEKLSAETGMEIKFEGNPEDQVIVFDLDETLLAGDKNPITPKREKEINAMGDRKVETVPKDHPLNKRGREIKYVLRPGAKELLEYLHSRGYKMVACTRNYSDRAEAICDHDPVLSKYISGSVGRTELLSDINKDFEKYPNHPDKLSLIEKTNALAHNTFVVFPKFALLKFKSIFNGSNIRWTSEIGSLGKYPPNIIDLLKAKGNHELDDCEPSHFLVDNSARREKKDSKKSGDWTFVNCNVDHNGDSKATPFFATDEVPKVNLTDEDGNTVEGYKWVKNVISDIEAGWRDTYKKNMGKEAKLAA